MGSKEADYGRSMWGGQIDEIGLLETEIAELLHAGDKEGLIRIIEEEYARYDGLPVLREEQDDAA